MSPSSLKKCVLCLSNASYSYMHWAQREFNLNFTVYNLNCTMYILTNDSFPLRKIFLLFRLSLD